MQYMRLLQVASRLQLSLIRVIPGGVARRHGYGSHVNDSQKGLS
ncbi:MAG: hypothetical protein RI985_393 [Chloroflexota bacterium]|jgi:hypothetical protein